MKTSKISGHAAVVGLFAVVLFVLCTLWRFTMTDPAVLNFHLLALKTLFPGFNGFDFISMLWGAALSFVYGILISFAYHALHCDCTGCKK